MFSAKGCVPVNECRGDDLVRMESSHQERVSTPLNDDMHIQPQRVEITIRPNTKHEFSFKAKKSENAVDIYFLLDVSGSMGPIKEQLRLVPAKLIQVSNISTLYQKGNNAMCSQMKDKRSQPFIDSGKGD